MHHHVALFQLWVQGIEDMQVKRPHLKTIYNSNRTLCCNVDGSVTYHYHLFSVTDIVAHLDSEQAAFVWRLYHDPKRFILCVDYLKYCVLLLADKLFPTLASVTDYAVGYLDSDIELFMAPHKHDIVRNALEATEPTIIVPRVKMGRMEYCIISSMYHLTRDPLRNTIGHTLRNVGFINNSFYICTHASHARVQALFRFYQQRAMERFLYGSPWYEPHLMHITRLAPTSWACTLYNPPPNAPVTLTILPPSELEEQCTGEYDSVEGDRLAIHHTNLSWFNSTDRIIVNAHRALTDSCHARKRTVVATLLVTGAVLWGLGWM